MIKNRVIHCLESIGCFVDEDSENKIIDIIEDSIMFISFIVELEHEFELQIPDDYLAFGSLQKIDDVCSMLISINKDLTDEKLTG